MTDPEKAESCGQSASLRCAEHVTLDRPYCGEGGDVFIICARFRLHRSVSRQSKALRVGYRELHTALWGAQASERCPHGNRSNEEVKLSLGCATVVGFGNYLENTVERILIHLTAGSTGARWLALATIPFGRVIGDEVEDQGIRQILLRRNGCCFQCAIDQTAMPPGKWFIIV